MRNLSPGDQHCGHDNSFFGHSTDFMHATPLPVTICSFDSQPPAFLQFILLPIFPCDLVPQTTAHELRQQTHPETSLISFRGPFRLSCSFQPSLLEPLRPYWRCQLVFNSSLLEKQSGSARLWFELPWYRRSSQIGHGLKLLELFQVYLGLKQWFLFHQMATEFTGEH